MMNIKNSFQQATQDFKKFLAENNLPTDIVWLFREDVFSTKSKNFHTDFWLKMPLISNNEKLTAKYYKKGQKLNLGICLTAFGICENKVCCCVIIPKDKDDSEFLFFSPEQLKFSFVKDLPNVKTINNFFIWQMFKLLTFRYKQGCYVDNLPPKTFAV